MTIKALEELRRLVDISREEYVQGRVSYVTGFNEIADAIEAEVNERFMALPVDADGVPIRVDDKLVNVGDGIIYTVAKLEFDGRYWWYVSGDYCFACDCARHKPRTVEDVIRDAVHGDLTVEGAAEEIRELMSDESR